MALTAHKIAKRSISLACSRQKKKKKTQSGCHEKCMHIGLDVKKVRAMFFYIKDLHALKALFFFFFFF